MAIYHASATIISRGKGKSVVAAAAYRVGNILKDERLGKNFDYTKKQGIDFTAILAPDNVPDWVYNRERLWNMVEAVERRKDSQLAREFNIALPVELSRQEMKDLAFSYVREQFVERGMIADVAFHDLDSHNPHFHVLLTMRDITEAGFGNKNRDWNSIELLVQQRQAWADRVNTALDRAGRAGTRIDHRSLVEQGITDRLPQVHLGPELHQLRQRAIEAGRLDEFRENYERGDLYESIEEINRQMAECKAELALLLKGQSELEEEEKEPSTSVVMATKTDDSISESLAGDRYDQHDEFLEEKKLKNIKHHQRSMNDVGIIEGGNNDFPLSDPSQESGKTLDGNSLQPFPLSPRDSSKNRSRDAIEPFRTDSETVSEAVSQTGLDAETLDGDKLQPFSPVSRDSLENRSRDAIEPSRTNSETVSEAVSQTRLEAETLDGDELEPFSPLSRDSSENRSRDTIETPRTSSVTGTVHDVAAEAEIVAESSNLTEAENRPDTREVVQQRERRTDQPTPAPLETDTRQNLENSSFVGRLKRLLRAFLRQFARTTEKGEIICQAQNYTLRASEDLLNIEIHEDARGSIFRIEQKWVKVSSLTERDLERLENTLHRFEGKRQVEKYVSLLFDFLRDKKAKRFQTSSFSLEFETNLSTLSYYSLFNPDEYLRARWNGKAWLYEDGNLSSRTEAEMINHFGSYFQARERQKEKERIRNGQQQVERCFSRFVRYLEAQGTNNFENSIFSLKFDPNTQLLGFHIRFSPDEYLRGRWNGKTWLYEDGQLSRETESIIVEVIEDFLDNQERQRGKERGKGFSL